MLHHPLVADRAESVRWLSAKQEHTPDHENGGSESYPDRRAKMHVLIIGNTGGDCKHSRIHAGRPRRFLHTQ